MEKAHKRINWENYPSVATPLNETNLNKMDQALDEVDNRVLGLDSAKLDKATANTMVKDVSFVEETGIFTVTLLDGTTKTFDTKLEKIATNFRYDYEKQKLIIDLADGTKQEVDLSTLISNYEFVDGDVIAFNIGSDGTVTANVKDGTITESKLQPNFLADVKTEVAKAKSHSDGAYENAVISSNASQEAKTYRDEAKQYRDETQALSDIGIATTEVAGLVKPDGTTITVDEDGTIHSLGGQGTVDYTELENKPTINGVEITGDLTTEDLNIDLGTVDYTELENKPTINGVELNGNKTTADLNIKEGTTDYTELNNKPKINGVEITGDLTSDDLNIKAGDNAVYLTQEEYDELPDSKLTDGVEYRITDAGTDGITASNIVYDNSSSGLEATTTQQAIDKLNDKTIYFSSVLIGRYTTSATQGETVTITITFPTTKKPTECVFVPCSLVIGILVDEPIIKINENTVTVDIKLYLLNTTSQPRVSGYIIYK